MQIKEYSVKKTINYERSYAKNLQHLERRPHQFWLVFVKVLFPGRIGIWRCWFLRREKSWRTRRKTLGARESTNKLNTNTALSLNLTRTTLLGREWSRRCIISASLCKEVNHLFLLTIINIKVVKYLEGKFLKIQYLTNSKFASSNLENLKFGRQNRRVQFLRVQYFAG